MKQPEPDELTQHRAVRDDPEAMARHAISLLERAIHDEFGIALTHGAELEFGVQHRNSWRAKDDEGIYGVPLRHCTASDYRASAARDTPDLFFPDSRRVAFCYRENTTSRHWNMLEVVVTHRPTDRDGSPLPNDVVRFARTIQALRRQLREGPSGYLPSSRDKSAGEIGADHWRSFRRDALRRLSTAPVDPKDGNNKHGLHLNVGLVNAETGEEILKAVDPATRSDLLPCLRHGIADLFRENLSLIASEQSLKRWDKRMSGPHAFVLQVDEKTHTITNDNLNYLQNAIPDASANAYYAVLLQVAGVLHALRTGQFTHDPSSNRYAAEPWPHVPFAKSAGEPKEAISIPPLKPGNLLLGLLESCEPGLGEHLFRAVAKHPPARSSPTVELGRG